MFFPQKIFTQLFQHYWTTNCIPRILSHDLVSHSHTTTRVKWDFPTHKTGRNTPSILLLFWFSNSNKIRYNWHNLSKLYTVVYLLLEHHCVKFELIWTMATKVTNNSDCLWESLEMGICEQPHFAREGQGLPICNWLLTHILGDPALPTFWWIKPDEDHVPGQKY